jgi:hypothetical protein
LKKSIFIAAIMPDFLCALTRISLLDYYCQIFFFCRIMYAGSPQCRVRQRTEGDRVALRAKIMDQLVIAERNVVQSDIMVAPLDSIHDTI